MAPGTTLYVGEVTGIDLAARTVKIQHGLYRHRHRPLTYDHIVPALGGVPNTCHVPGLADYAFDMQRLERVFALRNHLTGILEQGDVETDPTARRRLQTVVVAGGGTNGIQVVAGIRDLLGAATKPYPHLKPDDFRVVLVHAGERLLVDLPENRALFAERLPRGRGVDVRLNRRVV